MTKFIATLGLRLLNALGIIALAKAIHNAINGNVNFATPPSLSAFQTATNETETAVNDVAAAKANLATKVAIQEAKLKVLKDLMRAMAKYVDIIANGDKAIIESAAMTAGNQAEITMPTASPTPVKCNFVVDDRRRDDGTADGCWVDGGCYMELP